MPNCRLCRLGRPQNKIKSLKRDKYVDLARELKKKLGT